MTEDIFYDEGLSEKQLSIHIKLAESEMSTQNSKKNCYAYIFKSGIDKKIKISYTKKHEVDKALEGKGDLSVRQLLEYNANRFYDRIPARTKEVLASINREK